jgi:hypothetical protein
MSNCFNVIDFLAIFPGLMALVIMLLRISESTGDNNRLLVSTSEHTLHMILLVRFVRVCRVLRIAKVARYSQTLSSLLAVLSKVSQSGLLVVLMLLSFMTILSATLVFFFESDSCEATGLDCAGTPADFESIPAAFWWAITTLTTVGYGDVVPRTVAGKIVGAATSIIGIILLAISIALVSINFREILSEEEARAARQQRGGPAWPESRQREMQEVEELLEGFDLGCAELRDKLRGLVSLQDEKSRKQLDAMLDMLGSHSTGLTTDIRILMQRLMLLQQTSQATPTTQS